MDRNDLIREIQARYQEADRAFNELERRHWAAREALELGRGGIALVSKALRMSPNTIKRGIQDIATPQANPPHPADRIRKTGGGRKPKRSISTRSARSAVVKDSADGSLQDGANLSQGALHFTSGGLADVALTARPHSTSENRLPRPSEGG